MTKESETSIFLSIILTHILNDTHIKRISENSILKKEIE